MNRCFLIAILLFTKLIPAFGQTKTQTVTLLQTIELIKKERVSAQDEFHVIQSKIGAPGAKPTLDQLKQYSTAVIRIKNLRYSFGVDSSLTRVYFQRSSNQTQNKLGEEEFSKAYGSLIGFDLKTEPPFSAKDIDQASLCLRAMFTIVNLKVELDTSSDSQIQYRIKSR